MTVEASAEPLMLLDHQEGVSTVTLNQPDRLNAIGAEMTRQLIATLAEADAEPSTGCIVLTGAGRAFCSGGDVGNMGESPTVDGVLHRDWHLTQVLLATEKPVLAMVNGAAVGLGATLAMSCDIVYAADDAPIGDTHVLLGVLAGDGAMIPLLLNAGPMRTKDFVLRGHLVSGAEAAAAHLVNGAFPSEQLAEHTYACARDLAARPLYAVRATKMIINRYQRWATGELLETSLGLELHSMRIPEHAEAVERFKVRQVAQRSER
ncbi:MAG: enoyl-CoA hydratase/isomerase family protein [Acidimicrobiales bacterium]